MDYKTFFTEFFTSFWGKIGVPLVLTLILVGSLSAIVYLGINYPAYGLAISLALIGFTLMIHGGVYIYDEIYRPAKSKAIEVKLQPLFELRASQLIHSLAMIWPIIGLYQHKIMP